MIQEKQPIPKDTALQLCADIREEYQGRWFSNAFWQCWGCVRFTHGDPDKMCFHNQPDNRGCALINARYKHQQR